LDDRAIDLQWEDCLWPANGSPMSSGARLNLSFLPNRQSQREDGRASRTASVSWALSSCCAPAVRGTICLPNWAVATAQLAGDDSACGHRLESGQRSGNVCSTLWGNGGASTCREPSWTVPRHALFLGGSHGPEPHGSWKKRRKTAFDSRCQRIAPCPDCDPGQRAGRQNGHCVAGFHTTYSRASWASAIPSGYFPRRPCVRLGQQHPSHAGSRRALGAGPAPGRCPRFGSRSHALGGGRKSVVVQQSSSLAVVLRA